MDPLRRNAGLAAGSLLASTATLLCCVLPAVLVSLGAGAAVVGLVSTFPQLVWLSERKVVVFTAAAVMLAISGLMIWNGRRLPCPTDPVAARQCMFLRRLSAILWWTSTVSIALGATFAFLLPWIFAA
jgi:hypothetical protein